MCQLLHQSQVRAPFNTPALTALLHKARAFNRARLSGLLLHAPDGRFLQILEGEEAVVRELYYDHAAADPHHPVAGYWGLDPAPSAALPTEI